MSNVRHWILFISFLAILQLVGNLLLFNVLLVYPYANHLLPEQYKGQFILKHFYEICIYLHLSMKAKNKCILTSKFVKNQIKLQLLSVK